MGEEEDEGAGAAQHARVALPRLAKRLQKPWGWSFASCGLPSFASSASRLLLAVSA